MMVMDRHNSLPLLGTTAPQRHTRWTWSTFVLGSVALCAVLLTLVASWTLFAYHQTLPTDAAWQRCAAERDAARSAFNHFVSTLQLDDERQRAAEILAVSQSPAPPPVPFRDFNVPAFQHNFVVPHHCRIVTSLVLVTGLVVLTIFAMVVLSANSMRTGPPRNLVNVGSNGVAHGATWAAPSMLEANGPGVLLCVFLFGLAVNGCLAFLSCLVCTAIH